MTFANFRRVLDDRGKIRCLNQFRFTVKQPPQEDVFGVKPKVFERKGIYGRVVGKLKDLVQTFEEDMGDL